MLPTFDDVGNEVHRKVRGARTKIVRDPVHIVLTLYALQGWETIYNHRLQYNRETGTSSLPLYDNKLTQNWRHATKPVDQHFLFHFTPEVL